MPLYSCDSKHQSVAAMFKLEIPLLPRYPSSVIWKATESISGELTLVRSLSFYGKAFFIRIIFANCSFPSSLLQRNQPISNEVFFFCQVIERGDIPVFGICMGNQIVGLAAGAETYKLPLGNRSKYILQFNKKRMGTCVNEISLQLFYIMKQFVFLM